MYLVGCAGVVMYLQYIEDLAYLVTLGSYMYSAVIENCAF